MKKEPKFVAPKKLKRPLKRKIQWDENWILHGHLFYCKNLMEQDAHGLIICFMEFWLSKNQARESFELDVDILFDQKYAGLGFSEYDPLCVTTRFDDDEEWLFEAKIEPFAPLQQYIVDHEDTSFVYSMVGYSKAEFFGWLGLALKRLDELFPDEEPLESILEKRLSVAEHIELLQKKCLGELDWDYGPYAVSDDLKKKWHEMASLQHY